VAATLAIGPTVEALAESASAHCILDGRVYIDSMVANRSEPGEGARARDIVDASIRAEDEPAFRAAVQEGIEAADAGRVSPFEPVAAWLASWGTQDERPAPR
jgi:predicted transcriptional regulator